METNNFFRKIILANMALCLAWLPSVAKSFDWDDGKGQLHGFLTQGLVASTGNNFYGDSRRNVSLDFREIGLNGSYHVTPGIQLSAQIISRRTGEIDDSPLWLDYAFVDAVLAQNETTKLGIRLGRMKNPYGLYADTRDVAFTRPGIIVPQSIYFDRTRKLSLSGDGIHLYGSFQAPGGNIDAVFGIAQLPTNDRSGKSVLVGSNANGELASDRPSLGFRILYETDNGRWRGGVTYLTMRTKYQAVASDQFPISDRKIGLEPLIFSLQYLGEQWTITGEFTQYRTEVTQNRTVVLHSISDGWYLQSQYRFKPQWELLLRYESALSDKNDPDGKDFAAKYPGQQAFSRYSHDWVAGLRYDVNASFMVRAELHHIKGTNWLSSLENPVPGDIVRNWNMLMLLGSYRF